jgi:hypothetical protein
MSATDAEAFLEKFAAELEAINDDPGAVLLKARAAGYDVTQQEVVDAIRERYGAELTPEQLDQITAGS